MVLDQSIVVELSSRESFPNSAVLEVGVGTVVVCTILVAGLDIERSFPYTCLFNLITEGLSEVVFTILGILVVTELIVETLFIVDKDEGDTVVVTFSSISSSLPQIFELKSGITATIRKQTRKISMTPQTIVNFLTWQQKLR